MTKKFLTYSMIAAAALTGCTDEFQSYEVGNSATVDGLKGKLVEAGLVGGASVQDGSATRAMEGTHGSFVWMPEIVAEDGTIDVDDEGNRTNQKIGLCWTGVNDVHTEYTALDEVGVNVYTNYEYEHVGWIAKDADKLKFDECDGSLLNGAYIIDEGTPAANFTGTYNTEAKKRGNKYYYGVDEKTDEKTGKTYKQTYGEFGTDNKKLNLASGIFKTDNASVFEGKYVIYFPYTDKFTKGPIIANEPDHFVVDASLDLYATASKYAFQAGYLNEYKGGQSAQNFTADNVSSFAQIALSSHDGSSATANIKTVILYSGSEILYEYGIDASSVVAARDAKDMTLVKKVENEELQKSTNAVYSYVMNSGDETKERTDYETVSVSPSNPHRDLLALPVLPQTVKDLYVILVNDEGQTMKISMGTKEFKANKTIGLDCAITEYKWENTYYVFDEPSLAFALNKITEKGGTIEMLRSINLESANDDLYAKTIAYKGDVTIESIEESVKAELIVKSGTTRNINSLDATKALTIKVPVIVEGYGCCSNEVATLNIGTDEVKDSVIFTGLLTNYGTTNVGYEMSNCNVTFADVKNIWDEEYVKGQVSKNGENYSKGSYGRKLYTDAAKLNITNALGTESIVSMKDLTNDGVVTIDSKFARATADAVGQRSLKVNINAVENTGKLALNKEEAKATGDIVGGQITISENALVTVANGVKNMNATGYISVAGQANSETTDGRLDIKSAGTSTNEGTIENDGVINLLGGRLTNKGLFMDNLTGQVGGIAVDNGENGVDGTYIQKYYKGIKDVDGQVVYQTDLKTDGIYVSKTNSEDRMAFIVTDAVESKSCTVIEIIPSVKDGAEIDYTYDLSQDMYKGADLDKYDVLVNAGAKKTTFKAARKNAQGKYDMTKSIGHCLDVYSKAEMAEANVLTVENNVFVREGKLATVAATVSHLTVGNDVELKKGAALEAVAVAGSFVTADKAFTIGNDLINEGTVTTGDVRDLVVKHDVDNKKDAEITTNDWLDVTNDINNAGEIVTNSNFTVGHDFNIYKTGKLDSNGTPNVVGNNFKLQGIALFAMKTTTTINNQFISEKNSSITREGLSGGVYRATVNVGELAKTEGVAVGGWPTQIVK